jgi:preprotein translocase subunit YajC
MTNLLLLMGTTPTDGSTPNPMVVFFPYLIIIFIFYFMLIRPQQRRATEHRKFVDALQNGDKVVTESGLFGTVASVADDSVVLKVDDNVKMRFLKAKVAGLQPDQEPKKKPRTAKK